MSDRPPLPAETQRYVRRRCAFGCVLCGIPLYHYDHVTDWSETEVHDPEDIALLCARHHDMKTRGLITAQMVRDGLAAPYNGQHGHTSPFELSLTNGPVTIQLGSFCFEYTSIPEGAHVFPFFLDDLPIVSFIKSDGHLFVDIQLFDINNEPVLIVQQNEVLMATDQWDIEWVGTTITIRSAPRELLVTLTVDPAGIVKFGRGRVLANGIECELWDDRLALINNRNIFGGPGQLRFTDAQFGVAFGRPPAGVPLSMVNGGIPRYEVDLIENRRIVRQRIRQARSPEDAR